MTQNFRSTPSESARRRIMFIAGEDYYFLTYLLLVLLDELKCHSEAHCFREPIKLAYLADFLSSDTSLELLLSPGPFAIPKLTVLYDRAIARRIVVMRLIGALIQKEFVGVTEDTEKKECIFLLDHPKSRELLRNNVFQAERERVRVLRRLNRSIRLGKLQTLKENLFGDRVRKWDD